jgi:mRNA interferase HigB
VRVVSRRTLREHWQMPGRQSSEQPLKTWYNVVANAEWKTHSDVKADYGVNVDLAHGKYVFDIKANHYRLVCVIDFVRHGVLVLWVGTHQEYDELTKRNGEKLKQL